MTLNKLSVDRFDVSLTVCSIPSCKIEDVYRTNILHSWLLP